jgi:hypothetical protein
MDNTFIEGYMCRSDRGFAYINDSRDSLAYFQDYLKREKVCFTFDNITLYQLIESYPNYPHLLVFILKRLDVRMIYKRNQAFVIMPFR